MGASGNLQPNPMTSPVGNAKLTSTLVGDGKETLMARHQRDHGEGHRGNVMPKMKADSLAPGVYGRETRANPSRSTETERSHATFIRNEGKAMTSSIAVRNSFAKQNALAVPLFHLAAILRMASHQVHGIATLLNVWLERPRWPLQIPPSVARSNSPRRDGRSVRIVTRNRCPLQDGWQPL